MGKSRMMGAGHASSTLYKCSPNLPTGGGNKKQGITSRVGLNNWENREVQTQSNGIGRFKFHFMNQLGGVEPGHSMFGGRWNRADGLLKQFYEKQLQEEIKEDENNGIIIPLEKRLVRSTRLTSTPNDYLYLVSETVDAFEFTLDERWEQTEIIFFDSPTFFNGTIQCNSCSSSVSYKTPNYIFTIYKNGNKNIQSVKVTGYSVVYPSPGGYSTRTKIGDFTWTRTNEPEV
jgi:hypothetical protein